MCGFPKFDRHRIADAVRIAIGVAFAFGGLALALKGQVLGAIVGSTLGLVVAVQNQRRISAATEREDQDVSAQPRNLRSDPATAPAIRICGLSMLVAAIAAWLFAGPDVRYFAGGYVFGIGAIFMLVVLNDDVRWVRAAASRG